jgi:hypothetical protein
MKGVFSPAQRKLLFRLREEGGMLERRRGNMGIRYWNNYWTSASQPPHPAWYAQGRTIASLVACGALVPVARDKDGLTRCRLSGALAAAPSVPTKPPEMIHG